MRKKIMLFSVVALTLLGASCSKKENNHIIPASDPAPVPQKQHFVITSDSLNNPSNPYDSIGYWHNGLLDYLISNGYRGTTSSYDDLTKLINDYDQSNFNFASWNDVAATHEMHDIISAVPATYSQDAFLTDIGNDAVNGVISDDVKQKLATLAGIMDYKPEYATEPLGTVIYSITRQIDDQEDAISKSSMSDDDKKIVLESTSVLKHSLNYWSLYLDPEGQGMAMPEGFWSDFSNYCFADCRGISAAMGGAAIINGVIPGAGAAVLVGAAAVWSINSLN